MKGFDVAKQSGRFRDAAPLSRCEKRQTMATKVRNSLRWQKLRACVRKEEPFCWDPFGTHAANDRDVPSSSVHHILRIVERPEFAYHRDNLAAVCDACHGRLEARERHGKSSTHLFGVSKGGAGRVTFPPRVTPPRAVEKKVVGVG